MWYETRLDNTTAHGLMNAPNVANMNHTQRWCRNTGVSCVFNDDTNTKLYTSLFTPEYFESTFENNPGVTTMAFYESYGQEWPKIPGSFVPDTDLYFGFIARAWT